MNSILRHTFILLLLGLITSVQAGESRSNDYRIYPIPQSIEMQEGSLAPSSCINVVCDPEVDAITRKRVQQVISEAGLQCRWSKKLSTKQTNLQLRIDTLCRRTGKFDAHQISIDSHGILLQGEHTNALFFALASLEQIFEQRCEGALRCVRISDYADLKNRGVVEGYYGFPYSVEVRKELLRFMMRYKMNTYMYGGKSDPFHSQFWQQPYPETITPEEQRNGWMTQSQLRDIAQVSAETKVDFIWAIHPGNDFIESSTVIDDILRKFDKMHQLGVRRFAVFVDDVNIPTETAEMELTALRITDLQQASERRWNRPDASAQDTVRPLHFVPQIYCSGFADNDDQRLRFMNAIGQTPSHITVYTTGQWVWTVPNCEHTAQVRQEFGRQMSWWWNYPCNDNADGFIYPMDMYSNFADMPAVRSNATLPTELSDNTGLVANPMQQGMVSMTPLFSVADYAWNNHAFDNQQSWEASFEAILSDTTLQHAYRYLAEYLCPNDADRYFVRAINEYRESVDCRDSALLQQRSATLRDYLKWILGQCEVLNSLQNSSINRERLLYADLSPWLHKLEAECHSALLLMDEVEALLGGQTGIASHATPIAIDLDTNPLYSVLALEGMGEAITTSKRQATVSQRHLSPFVDYLIRKTLSLRSTH